MGKDLERGLKRAASYPEKAYFIPNGIHEEFFFVEPPKPASTINILFAGSLIPRKGVDICLKAIAKLNTSQIHLFIAGQGPLEQELKCLAKDLNIEHLLTFEGQIPPGRPMAEMMARAHFLVLPSHHEGRPNVVLEAMAAGRPVVASNIDGIRELVEHSITGYLFTDGDVDGLSSIIKKLIEHPESLEKMGRSAREWVVTHGLTWENTAREYIGLLQRFITP